MKKLLRWTLRVFMVLLVLAVAGILLLDTLARKVAEHELTSETGLEAKIGRLHIGLWQPVFTMEHLVVYNSAEFGGSPLVDLPELHIEYDRDALWAHKFHFPVIRFNLAEFNVVDDKTGRRNLDVLQKRMEAVAKAEAERKRRKKGADSAPYEFAGIDRLNLTLGRATHLDMNQPEKLEEFKMNVNHQTFANIKSEDDINGVLLVALLRGGVNVMQSGDLQKWLQMLSPVKK